MEDVGSNIVASRTEGFAASANLGVADTQVYSQVYSAIISSTRLKPLQL